MGLKVQPPLKSKKLPNALRHLGKLPVELDKIGVRVVKEVRRNCNGRYLKRRTGNLYNSWEYVLQTLSNHGWRLSVESSGVPYARIHDLGGMAGRGHKSRMRKRLYATRAWLKSRLAIKRIMRNYMTRIFRG